MYIISMVGIIITLTSKNYNVYLKNSLLAHTREIKDLEYCLTSENPAILFSVLGPSAAI